MISYADLSHFAGTWGLVFLVILFLGAVAYALWPSNRDKFKRAAHAPLDDDTDDDREETRQ